MNTLIQSVLANPQRAIEIAIVVAVVAVFAAIFMRRALRILFRVAIVVGVLAVIAGGVAILMNNVSLAGPPGPVARLQRFLTVDWAATSATGNGLATCADPAQLAAAVPKRRSARFRRAVEHAPVESPARAAGPLSIGAVASDEYPELVRRSYPGLPPDSLFRIAASTISGLPGWQIVKSDPKTFTIDALYKTRVFGFRDDVRVVVLPNSEIDVCSRSEAGEPGAHSLTDLFHGDFGANIGHVKEFYTALAPAADAAYRHEELKQSAEEHGVRF